MNANKKEKTAAKTKTHEDYTEVNREVERGVRV